MLNMYNGARQIGPRKSKLMGHFFSHITLIQKMGGNVHHIMNHLKIPINPAKIPTKKLSGEISKLRRFIMEEMV